MAKAKYNSPEYRAAYRGIKAAQARGEWLTCVQPVCLMTTRDIPPNCRAHVAHDDSGTVILGPAHARCNTSDGGKRNRDNLKPTRRRIL